MLDQEIQEANFQYLKKAVEIQKQVRRCEIEGSVYPLEQYILHSHYCGLINMKQLDILEEILTKR